MFNIYSQDTIFAQGSKPGKAGIAVFRISGSKSLEILSRLINRSVDNIKPRMMYHSKIYVPNTLEMIDSVMFVYFQAPASFTGEDVVEIHTHGSIAIKSILTDAVINLDGVRLAEPGEFSRRAFLHGKFDLTAAEGLSDLIEAETIWQHRQATKQMNGALKDLYSDWRQKLLSIISLLEAYIDFPDEEIPESIFDAVMKTIIELQDLINQHLNDNKRGELLREGIKLTILGKPNVGKSSLINFLMQRDIAIVSNIPGTTRDIVEGHLDIGGYPIILKDTAGIRSDSLDIIEQEGINRAIESAKNSDIKLIMLDASKSCIIPSEIQQLIDPNTIVIINKIDLLDEEEWNNLVTQNSYLLKLLTENVLYLSIKEKKGCDELLSLITLVADQIAQPLESPQITRARHRQKLKEALIYLAEFNLEKDLVLATEDVRMAMRSLSCLTGEINVEEILGEIFGNFCIGK